MTRRAAASIRLGALALFFAWMGAGLLGCAALPDDAAVVEILDEDSGVTITRLGRPVELYLESGKRNVADRFAFLGPFETNQMGRRDSFLWIAVPLSYPDEAAIPAILVDGTALSLVEPGRNAEFAGLQRSPYKIPTPWIATYYFRVGADLLTRLGAARDLRIQAVDPVRSGPLDLEYTAPAGVNPALAEFASR